MLRPWNNCTNALARSQPCRARRVPPREEIKLQVALITPLLYVKGYAAAETKAATERARLLIERAEALGEPVEDPLLLFSVLFGFGSPILSPSTVRCCAICGAIPGARRESRQRQLPGDRHRIDGHFPACTGHFVESRAHLDRESRSMILPSIVRCSTRFRRRFPRCRPSSFGRWFCGCLAIRKPQLQMPTSLSNMRAKSIMPLI